MSTPICTTLNAIRACEPCADGWAKLMAHLGKTGADDEPLPLTKILDSNGLGDAIWALRAVTGQDREIRRFAVWCARQVQHLMKNPRSLSALDVAERYADGLATDEELRTARAAAGDDAAWDAAGAAAWAAAGDDAAWDAARAAAWFAAGDAAAWFAAGDDAAWSAAGDAAWSAIRDRQAAEFRRVFGGEPRCAALPHIDTPESVA